MNAITTLILIIKGIVALFVTLICTNQYCLASKIEEVSFAFYDINKKESIGFSGRMISDYFEYLKIEKNVTIDGGIVFVSKTQKNIHSMMLDEFGTKSLNEGFGFAIEYIQNGGIRRFHEIVLNAAISYVSIRLDDGKTYYFVEDEDNIYPILKNKIKDLLSDIKSGSRKYIKTYGEEYYRFLSDPNKIDVLDSSDFSLYDGVLIEIEGILISRNKIQIKGGIVIQIEDFFPSRFVFDTMSEFVHKNVIVKGLFYSKFDELTVSMVPTIILVTEIDEGN